MSMVKRQLFPKRIVFLGPPGSGKGTQAALLSRTAGIPHISTGAIFRDHIARKTALGRKVSSILKSGRLVTDDLTNRLVKDRLSKKDCRSGYILDGYPRNVVQAKYLARIARPTLALMVSVPDREVVRRISGRRTAPDGTVYHVWYNPPPRSLRNKVKVRDDERPSVVRKRLGVYHRLIDPLLKRYRREGILIDIDGRPSIAAISRAIRSTIRSRIPVVTGSHGY